MKPLKLATIAAWPVITVNTKTGEKGEGWRQLADGNELKQERLSTLKLLQYSVLRIRIAHARIKELHQTCLYCDAIEEIEKAIEQLKEAVK